MDWAIAGVLFIGFILAWYWYATAFTDEGGW